MLRTAFFTETLPKSYSRQRNVKTGLLGYLSRVGSRTDGVGTTRLSWDFRIAGGRTGVISGVVEIDRLGLGAACGTEMGTEESEDDIDSAGEKLRIEEFDEDSELLELEATSH